MERGSQGRIVLSLEARSKILWVGSRSARSSNKVIGLDQASEGYRNFVAGVPNIFVIDSHWLVSKVT